MEILEKIDSIEDIKKLDLSELHSLAADIRAAILNRVSKAGGHVGSNLGVVELTIAYHYVFQSPKDKIVWDVSHQSYPHKILTGRKNSFLDETEFYKTSGYTSQEESEHDFFKVGHTSTSVSLAVGLAKARDMRQDIGNVVAVIGDGSLSGGLAFEGLNNAAELNSNLIIIVNDNQMSIDENFGGLYRSLKKLRETNGKSENNLFKSLGLQYKYLANGNNIADLISCFQSIKDIDQPFVLHINTEKGHGYQPANNDKRKFHWQPPFDLLSGEVLCQSKDITYSKLAVDFLKEKINGGNNSLIAINAGIPGMFDLEEFKVSHPDHYMDVGIAEGHSVSFAAGLAKNGIRPVLFHSSYFLARAYDQLSHDLAINQLPAVLLVGNGHVTQSTVTHQGIFDIPLINSIPNIRYLAPTNKEEFLSMLDWACSQINVPSPIAIRLPVGKVQSGQAFLNDYSLVTYDIVTKGTEIAILALGNFYSLGRKVRDLLEKQLKHSITLINPLFITTLDKKTLDSLKKNHSLIITLEDGSKVGGFGDNIATYYRDSNMRVLTYGAEKEFIDYLSTEKLYKKYHLNPTSIVADVLATL